MEKVQMVVGGKLALVDADMVKKMTKKQELVAEAMNLQKQLQEIISKIIRLNRTIRQSVQFL